MTDKPELYATHPEDGKRHRFVCDHIEKDPPVGSIILNPDLRFGVEIYDPQDGRPGAHRRDMPFNVMCDLGPEESVCPDSGEMLELSRLRELNATQSETIGELDTELSRLKARVAELEQSVRTVHGRERKLREQLDRSELDRQQADAKVKELEAHVEEWREIHRNAVADQSWKAGRIAELNAALADCHPNVVNNKTWDALCSAGIIDRPERNVFDCIREAGEKLKFYATHTPAEWRRLHRRIEKTEALRDQIRELESTLERSDESVQSFLSSFGTPQEKGENLVKTICRAFDKVRRESRDRIRELEDLLRKMTAALEAAMAEKDDPHASARQRLRDLSDPQFDECIRSNPIVKRAMVDLHAGLGLDKVDCLKWAIVWLCKHNKELVDKAVKAKWDTPSAVVAQPPVGVVRLPIYESLTESSKFKIGTFQIACEDVVNNGDCVLSPPISRYQEQMGCRPLAVTPVVGSLPQRRVLLRRLDAPEETQPENVTDGEFVFGNYTIAVDAARPGSEMSCLIVHDGETGRIIERHVGIGNKFEEMLDQILDKYRAFAENPAPPNLAQPKDHIADASKKVEEKPVNIYFDPKKLRDNERRTKPVRLEVLCTRGDPKRWFLRTAERAVIGDWGEKSNGAFRVTHSESGRWPKLIPVESPAEAHC